jgi:kumamolisin
MFILRKRAISLALLAVCLTPIMLVAGIPYPNLNTPKAIDLGVKDNAPLTVTVVLKLRNDKEMKQLMTAIYSPSNPAFHHFISPSQFRERFAPTDATVQKVMRYFHAAGLTATRFTGNLIRVSGSRKEMEDVFGVKLHTFEIPAHDTTAAYRFHAPTSNPQMTPLLKSTVQAVLGLDNEPRFHPHIQYPPEKFKPLPLPPQFAIANGAPDTPNQPGLWTIKDFVQYYNIQPLYDRQVFGKKHTIGIVTLASFTMSDAFAYWKDLGLQTDPRRITLVNVDGGPGEPSDESGSLETTIDVQQSGGIAPAAKIIVYQAPNTIEAYFDAFAKAIDSNIVDTLSTSWGIWEFFPSLVNRQDPKTGQVESELLAYNSLFVQAALQGQSLFAAAGDSGAYDANERRLFALPQFTKILSVDHPASQPFVTAVGGTTLPGPQFFIMPDGSKFSLDIKQEQAWGWRYLTDLCKKLGLDPVSCGIFPNGGGGGVSSFFTTPSYQLSIPGILQTEADQRLVDTTTFPPQIITTLPGHYYGRNVPDVSFNADPDTGYIVPYTSEEQGFITLTFMGGTSFTAPQLSGVTVLLDQVSHGRLGLLNMELYNLVRSNEAYKGHHPPFRQMLQGDNWFYRAHKGYNQAAGVGVMDVANFAAFTQP